MAALLVLATWHVMTGTSTTASGRAAEQAVAHAQAAARVAPKLLLERQVRVSRDSDRQALAQASGTSETAHGGQGRERNAGLQKLASKAQAAVAKVLADGWQLPIPKGQYVLTAGFGECSGLWAHCHTGQDFAAPTGTPIHAVARGVIVGTGWAGAYGNRTVERLDDGTELWYCHQSAIQTRPGQQVVAGQVIGLVGATGNTTGPHLHLEVRPGGGDPVDPKQALVAHGITP